MKTLCEWIKWLKRRLVRYRIEVQRTSIQRTIWLALSLALALTGLTATLLTLGGATAQAQSSTYYVAPDGSCGGMSPCYAVIQDAVDAATNGDTVKVAQGVYTSAGFQVVYIGKAITLTGGYTTTDWANAHPLTQATVIDAEDVARRRGMYIDGTGVPTITLSGLTVRRGYVQDAPGGGIYLLTGTVALRDSRVLSNIATGGDSQGGGMFVSKGTVVLDRNIFQGNSVGDGDEGGALCVDDGFVFLNGNTFQDNSASSSYGSGGGVYIRYGTVALSGNVFWRNTARVGGAVHVAYGVATFHNDTFQENSAWRGGGLSVYEGTATLSGTTFLDNSAYKGGGLSVWEGIARLSRGVFQDNSAYDDGGGIYLRRGDAIVNETTFQGNSAAGVGGGVSVWSGSIVLNHIDLKDNLARVGGGIGVQSGTATLGDTIILSNTADQYGGGVYAAKHITMCNSRILSNAAGTSGGGIAVAGGTVSGTNVVVANNTSPWEGIYFSGGSLTARHWTLASNGKYALSTNGGSAALTNTIVASHTIAGLWGSNIAADHTLFFNSGTPCGGGAACTNNLSGNPEFIDPAAGDYHLGPGSAAVDLGTDAGVTTDIDGEPRPMGTGHDVGADEQPPSPVAAFTHSAPDWIDRPTIFTNTTTATGTVSYRWAFGDGTTSTVNSPTHAYAAPGTYTAVLTATNTAGSSVATDTVTIYAADFETSSPDWLGQTTVFTNATIGEGPITYAWDFGDGATSSQETPTHTYANPGLYTVVLTATNAAGSGVATDTVTVYGSPAADFTHSSPDWLGQTTHFTNATTTTPAGDSTVNYRWDFGDGDTSTLEHPDHEYADPGAYTVVLTATNAAGSDVATDTVNIYSAPSVTFTTSTPDWLGESTDFTATVTTTPSGDSSVNLTWDFGDGTVRTGSTNTSHTYADSGTYTVILTATNAAGTDIATETVTIHGPPTADFTTSSPDWLGQAAVFTNTTTGEGPITYTWDFGDGATSTEESPTRTYTAPGTHTVTLTAINPAGSDVVTNTVTVYGEPTVDFAASPTEGFYPLDVNFTPTVDTTPSGDPTLTYSWRFGDGETSTQPNPSHTYDAAGTYTVSLEVSNAAGDEIVTCTDYIAVYEPVQADFTAAPRQAIAPATVQFTDTSTGPVAAWTWDFGDGETSALQHPTHTYEAAGMYTVSLTARAAGGSALWPGGTDTVTRTGYITVHEAVAADFSASPVSGTLPLEVTFTNQSTGAYTETLWHFGDGVTSTQESPTHTYTSAGVYTVTLDVSGPGGSDSLARENYITVSAPPAPIADFTASPVYGTLPLEVAFTNQSTGAYTETLWHFGDGVTSTQESPTHTYTSAGVYTVTLDVSGPGGSDTLSRPNYITVEGGFDVFLPLVVRKHHR